MAKKPTTKSDIVQETVDKVNKVEKGEQEEAAPSFLTSLHRGKRKIPARTCIYGGHGIGKSTIGALFPNPIFISTEGGLDAIDCVSFPQADHINEVVQNIRHLIKDEHDFLTCVVDTVDWLVEPLIMSDIEDTHEPAELGYGKGSLMIAEAFREILEGLDVLRHKRGMNIVLLAHSEVKRFDSPLTEPYDRYIPKINKKCNALLQEWTDVLAYAGYRVVIKKTKTGFGSEVSRGISSGERYLHFQEQPGYLAKSRYPGTPDMCALDMDEISKCFPIAGVNM